MPRRRLGVALLVPAPVDREVDGLRRASGDGSLGKVPPHVTLVPPVNVREDRLAEADDLVRLAAAATAGPLTVRLGPPATFLPDTPVLHLPVGEGAEAVRALRDRVFVEPLARPLTWPFVPHVTLADEMGPARVEAALAALAGYEVTVAFDRAHLLEEGPDRVWRPVADHPLTAPAVVGRGGLPVELAVSDEPDPGAAALLPGRPFTVTARREGEVVGVARGWTATAGQAHLAELVVVERARRQGVGAHLLAAVEVTARERGCTALVAAMPPGGDGERFLRARGWAEGSHLTLERPL